MAVGGFEPAIGSDMRTPARKLPGTAHDSTRAAWRARREARREKQRAQNVVRAQKMHIARLAHEQDAPTKAARASAKQKALTAHVGCSGWYYWHWGGAFY